LDFAGVRATAGAQWLAPSQWPAEAGHLFRPGPINISTTPPVITLYDQVLQIFLNPGGIWHRHVPEEIAPPGQRNPLPGASRMQDGPRHQVMRPWLTSINHGSAGQARRFTQTLVHQLASQLTQQKRPWNLSAVIYPASLAVVIQHRLAAPVLLPYAQRLLELALEVATAPDGYFGIPRQPELEDILRTVIRHRRDLPPGLARHLIEMGLPEQDVIAQFAMLIMASESQATITASLIAMLLEHDLRDCVMTEAAGDPDLMRRLIAEGGRLGIAFPANLVYPDRAVTIDGYTIRPGERVLISYAAANRDPARFGPGADVFDPRAARPSHIAFGEARRRCQGARGSEQFMEDATLALFKDLPPDVRLADGLVLRETRGISWAIPDLPVTAS
jgi:cytochrome P450